MAYLNTVKCLALKPKVAFHKFDQSLRSFILISFAEQITGTFPEVSARNEIHSLQQKRVLVNASPKLKRAERVCLRAATWHPQPPPLGFADSGLNKEMKAKG